MKTRLWVLCLCLGLCAGGFSVLAIGGAAMSQPGVANQARAESMLAQTYIVLDRELARWVPAVGRVSRGLAQQCFADAFPAIEANPALGLHLLLSNSRGPTAALAVTAYWAAPILLFLALVLYCLRPRGIHLIRT